MIGMGMYEASGIKSTSTSKRTMAWTIPERGDLPPFFTFAAVLAIAPVAGIPPKNPTKILPVPSAISSVLELCVSPPFYRKLRKKGEILCLQVRQS